MSWFGNTTQQPKEPKKFANISNDQINSNQQAVPVKYLAGRNYVAGDYISPAYNPIAQAIKAEAGKGQPNTTTGYKYFADFALLFCMGGRQPVDAIRTIISDSDIIWTGNVTRTAGTNKEIITVPNFGVIHLYWGTETQAIDNVLLTPRAAPIGGGDPQDQTTWPPNAPVTGGTTHGGLPSGDPNPYSGHYDRHPAYRGQCYAVFKKWKLGRDRTAVPNIIFELQRGCPYFGGDVYPANDLGVNPVPILFDWLTDTRFGMGLPESMLDSSSFTSLYAQLYDQGAYISPVITAQEDFRQIVAELLEYFDGWIRIGQGALIEVGAWQHGTDVVSAATLTDDYLLGEPELEPQGWGPTVNEVTIVYKDRQHHFNDYVQSYRDPNNFRITGAPRPETLSRPWITDAAIAKSYARESGAILALPYTRGTLRVKREWLTDNSIHPGVVFEYDSGFYGLSFLLRLLEVEYGSDSAADATLTVEWDRSKWPSLYVPPPFQGPGGFFIGPRLIYQQRITEVPYLLADHQFATQIVPLAARGDVTAQGFRVWVSFDGTTYQQVPNDSSTSSFSVYGQQLFANLAGYTEFWVTLYGVGLDEIVTQTTAQMNDDTLLIFMEGEVASVGTVTPDGLGNFKLDVLRARLGTSANDHAISTPVYLIFRSRLTLLDNAGFVPGATVYFKLQPFTADLDYDLGSITAIAYTIGGFAFIPAPVFSPGSGTFVGTQAVDMTAAPTGCTARYTSDGTAVTGTSAVWPGTLTLSSSTTLRGKFFRTNGQTSAETTATYTQTAVGGGGPPGSTCGAPSWSYTGYFGHASVTITLTPTTSGSTIYKSLDGGATTTYTAPFTLALGHTVEFWATATGYEDSAHVFIANEHEGGG